VIGEVPPQFFTGDLKMKRVYLGSYKVRFEYNNVCELIDEAKKYSISIADGVSIGELANGIFEKDTQ
jgi:hypothetical protein